MDTRGLHLLVELHDCDAPTLNDPLRLLEALRRGAESANVRIVAEASHRYEPVGASAVVLIEESHLSIHTWPEHRYAAVDLFTCGAGDPERAVRVVAQALGAGRADALRVERGLGPPGPSLRTGELRRFS